MSGQQEQLEQDSRAKQQVSQPSVSNIICRLITAKSGPTTLRMCPPATLRNWKFHKPLLAVGNVSGTIQIFNLSSGKLYRELCVHSYAVRGIEWIGLNAFASFAMSESFQGNDSNWELQITELDTGRTVQLKCGRSSETSVIKSVKASHQRQYLIIIYQSDPFEIWDLDTLSLLKRVPKEFSGVVAAEWSPLYSERKDINQTSSSEPSQTHRGSRAAPWRENFVVTNKKGELFHFSIAGNVVKELSKIPPETTVNKSVTAIAWKSDHVVLGRNDGSLSVWDLGEKESRTVATMKGSIKRIRFAPGRGNMKIVVLFEEGMEIWDVRRMRLMSSANSPRSHLMRIEDADWGSSDRPVVLTSNGTVVVTDLAFKHLSALSHETNQYRAADTNTQGHNTDPCYLQ